MVIAGNDKIKIKQVLMNGNEPSYVEYFSHVDSRNHIISASRFVDVFGVSMDELSTFNKLQAQKEK